MKHLCRVFTRFIGLSLLPALAFNTTLLHAQPLDKTTNQALSDYLKHQNTYGRFNGNILIAKGDEIIYEQAIGYADVQSHRPITKDNLFKVGSITKQLTAAAIMRLSDQEKLSVDQPISKFFPTLKNGDKITIAMLLNHTAGISRDISWRDQEKSCRSSSLVKSIIHSSNTYPPSLLFNYSNAGYHLLGKIIEQTSGVSYNDYITQEFLRPLGMKDSSMKLTLSFQLAKSYELSGLVDAHITPPGCAWSAGELFATSRDLYIWSRALNKGQVISPKSVQAMYSNQFGMFEESIDGTSYFVHHGAIDGFKTLLLQEPQEQLTVIALSNFNNTNIHLLSYDLIKIINGDKPVHKVTLPKTNLANWQNDIDIIGNYQDKEGVPLQVVYQDGILTAKVNQFKLPLKIQNKNSLFAVGVDNRIHINRNQNDTTREIVFFSRDGRYLSRFERIR